MEIMTGQHETWKQVVARFKLTGAVIQCLLLFPDLVLQVFGLLARIGDSLSYIGAHGRIEMKRGEW